MLPKEWKETRLGKHALKVGSGITPKGGSNSYKNYGIPLIRSQNVLWGYLDLSDVVYIDEMQHQKMSGSYVQPDDILLNITGASIGRASVVPINIIKANVNQHVCIIRLNHEINPIFLLNFILSIYGQKQIEKFQAGGNRQGLNFAQIRSFRLKLPPILEQIKIAQILSTWDKAIETTEQLLTNSQQQKKALMQQLLTGMKRFSGFNDNWKFANFDELFFIANEKKTQVKSSDYLCSGKIPIVDQSQKFIAGFTNNTAVYSDVPVIIFGDHTRIIKWVDFIFAPGADGTQVLKTKELINLKLGFYLISYISIKNLGYSRHIKELKEKNFKFPVDKREQKKIVLIFSKIDHEIEILEQELAYLNQEKKSLMQQLLTGKRRVKL